MSRRLLLINGPNLNLLGTREPQLYGSTTLQDVQNDAEKQASSLSATLESFQANSEGAIVDRIHAARGHVDAIIINAGAYTHTSVAIRDALVGVDIPFVEAEAVICGLGVFGYTAAIDPQTKINLHLLKRLRRSLRRLLRYNLICLREPPVKHLEAQPSLKAQTLDYRSKQSKVLPVNPLDDIPAGLPRVNLCAPTQRLIRKLNNRRLLQAHLRRHSKVRHEGINATREFIFGEKTAWKQDEIRLQGVHEIEPQPKFIKLLGLLSTIDQVTKVHKRLQTDDL
ncbi:hypothetical protein HG530_014357 [Fusarium avenaceum]|nr:hypothetical protein HG530_014357 [Fusarium avenaceum]